MLQLSKEVRDYYDKRLERAGIDTGERADYRKWARFYLDFCQKYGHPPRSMSSMAPFSEKLVSKGQSSERRVQAEAAVRLLITPTRELPVFAKATSGRRAREESSADTDEATADRSASGTSPVSTGRGGKPLGPSPEGFVPAGRPSATSPIPTGRGGDKGVSWERQYEDLEGAIRLRNYSGRTLNTYRMWVRKFQTFLRSKPPDEVDTRDVKAFLTDLAVHHGVAGSTQNQAFNALLFFFRHVLGREFGKVDGVVRAKRRPYVPTVLSRAQVDLVLEQLEAPYRLVASLLYGCGLRLTECLELRVHCFDLDAKLVVIHDGKGQKDRTVPLPKLLVPEIELQMENVRHQHQADLSVGYAGVFLPRQLEKKFKNAARDYIWQWFFPAASLTMVAATRERRRYHLHDSQVQSAVKAAAARAGIPRRVTPHTFRHTFASHLLLANYDLPTIQKLLGHSDIKTTMIYLQTVPGRKVKEARSPLDLAGEF